MTFKHTSALLLAALTLGACADDVRSPSEPLETTAPQTSSPASTPVARPDTRLQLRSELDFQYSDADAFEADWFAYDIGSNAPAPVQTADGTVLEGFHWVRFAGELIPYTEADVMVVELTYRPDAQGSEVIMGLEGTNTSGTRAVNRFGEAARSNQYTVSSRKSEVTPNADGSVTLRGQFAANDDRQDNDVEFHPDVAFVRPVIIANYKDDDALITLQNMKVFRRVPVE